MSQFCRNFRVEYTFLGALGTELAVLAWRSYALELANSGGVGAMDDKLHGIE